MGEDRKESSDYLSLPEEDTKKKTKTQRPVAQKKSSKPTIKAEITSKKTKQTVSKPVAKQSKTVVKQEQSEHLDVNFQQLPGQKYKTPDEGDATRIFYQSLYEQKSDSKMAEKWCLEYGVLSYEEAQSIYKKNSKKK